MISTLPVELSKQEHKLMLMKECHSHNVKGPLYPGNRVITSVFQTGLIITIVTEYHNHGQLALK